MKIEMRGKSAYISGYVNAVERDSKTLHNAQGAFVERAETGVFRQIERRGTVVPRRRDDHCCIFFSSSSSRTR